LLAGTVGGAVEIVVAGTLLGAVADVGEGSTAGLGARLQALRMIVGPNKSRTRIDLLAIVFSPRVNT